MPHFGMVAAASMPADLAGVAVAGVAAGGPRPSSAEWLRARSLLLLSTGMAMVLTTAGMATPGMVMAPTTVPTTGMAILRTTVLAIVLTTGMAMVRTTVN